jgi:hypothetical protein
MELGAPSIYSSHFPRCVMRDPNEPTTRCRARTHQLRVRAAAPVVRWARPRLRAMAITRFDSIVARDTARLSAEKDWVGRVSRRVRERKAQTERRVLANGLK